MSKLIQIHMKTLERWKTLKPCYCACVNYKKKLIEMMPSKTFGNTFLTLFF